MPTPPLSEVEAAADDIAGALVRSSAGLEALWRVEGAPGAGKSTCLARIAEILDRETDLIPILVTPPGHHLDAGPSALTDVAVGLASRQVVNRDVAQWKDQVGRWADRLNSVRQWVTANSSDVVLLCDEPRSWGANRSSDDFFARRSFQVGFFLAALPCRRVISGDLPVPIEPQDSVRLAATTGSLSWVTDYAGWGSLASAARQVMDSGLVNNAMTPLQLRLLIACVAMTSVDEVTERLTPLDTGTLVRGLAKTLRGRGYTRAWDAWLRLSLTRRAFTADLLEALMPSRTTTIERDIVRHCIVYGDAELRVHDQLKLYAFRWRTEHAGDVARVVTRANRTLFRWHQLRFDQLAPINDPRAISESLEAFHFASATGSAELLREARPVFVDQLDALGWSLSYEHRDYLRAADAFEEAIRWDRDDDYAHHYLAYNLDRAGRRVEDVERHYRVAVDLNGTHSWWRARLIIFLLSRGRIAEARTEWEEALLELGLGDGDASADTYESLHCWVAGALLDVGEIRWARDVMDEVPQWVHGQINSYAALVQRAEALLELGEGTAVVPAWRLRPRWWESGPELLQHRLGTGEVLVRWLASRVESRDEEGIRLRSAVLEVPQEGPPSFAWTRVSTEEFDALCRDAVGGADLVVGSFIEVGIYAMPQTHGGPATTLIRVLPTRVWPAVGLPIFHRDRHVAELVHPR